MSEEKALNGQVPGNNVTVTQPSQTPSVPKTNLINLSSQVIDVTNRFTFLNNIIGSAKDILQKPHIDVLLHGVILSDPEISSLAFWITNQTKVGKVYPKEIEHIIKQHQSKDQIWQGKNYVGERGGEIFVQVGKHETSISNFTLNPLYTITVPKGNKYHVYEVIVKNDPKKYTLMLLASDYDSLTDIQKQVKTQLVGTSASINRGANFVGDLRYKYIDLANWEFEKEGTSLLGLERLDNQGPKYFCTPHAIYDLNGSVSDAIVYMGNEHSSIEEVRKLTNLGYNKEKWTSVTAPTFLRNIIHSNEKWAMMSLLGWMGVIPHDYVVRKESGTGFFPHCHLIGEPGAGKSTLLTLVKQFMGHNDSSAKVFSTAFEVQKSLNASYTIPAVLDEYAKTKDVSRQSEIDKTLVESFTKADFSKGRADMTSAYFKYKNPLLMAGQIPTSDQATAQRLIVVPIHKTFHNTKEGVKSVKHLKTLQKLEDKNFWVGFNLWCAKHSNEEVLKQYEYYKLFCKQHIKDSRSADIYAMCLLGLYYMHKLAMELDISEVDLGYMLGDLDQMPSVLAKAAGMTEDGQDQNSPLHDFLDSIASFGTRYGNSNVTGNLFGKGLAVMNYKPTTPSTDPGQFGGNKKEQACIYGRELILIRIKDMTEVLNQYNRNKKFSENELQTFIDGKFREAMANPTDGLVLAPKQYVTRYGRYTAFDKEALFDLYPALNNIQWKD